MQGRGLRDRQIKQYKAREKVTQKMTREGAVEVNAATGKKKRISNRIRDADLTRKEAARSSRNRQRSPYRAAQLPRPQPTRRRFPMRRGQNGNRTPQQPSASWSISTGRTPERRAKRRRGKHRQKQKPAPTLPACSLPTRNGQRRSLKGISENRTKQPTVWTRQGRLSPKKRNLCGSAPLTKPPGRQDPPTF